jgi:hypothetical protein
MVIDTSSFIEIEPSKGGRKVSALTLAKSGYFRGNKFFIKEHHLEDTKSVKIRALKLERKIVVALNFSDDDEENSFKISFGKSPDGELTSIWFSGRSIFSEFNIDYKEIIKNKSIKLKLEIQQIHGKKEFVFEIPLKT